MGVEVIFPLLAVLGSGGVGTVTALYYYVLGNMIDSLSGDSGLVVSDSYWVRLAASTLATAEFKRNINSLALQMLYIAIGSYFAAWITSFCLNLTYDRFGDRLKIAYFKSLLQQDISFFDRKSSGELVGFLAETGWRVQDAYSFKLAAMSEVFFQVVIGSIISLLNGWKLALVMFSTFPLVCITLVTTSALTRVFVKRTTKHGISLSGIIYEAISSIRTVKSLDGETQEENRMRMKVKKFNIVYLLKAFSLATSYASSSFIVWAMIALSFWYGGRLVLDGEMTVGGLFQVFGFMVVTVIGLSSMLTVIVDFFRANQAAIELLKIIEREPALPFSKGLFPDTLQGNIEFRKVSFVYPTRPTITVLYDFSLSIKQGQTIALVGSSGSGKSTVIQLISKFYQPISGSILIDGEDMNNISSRWLHQHIGIVSQEPTLFASSIKDNITYGLPPTKEVTMDEIIQCAIEAKAHDFVSALPDGYNTLLGERGVSLSGGQRQRIAIARAMIRNPSVLLLDEATSALDTETESIVQEALTKLMKGRTCIIVAHRLSTIMHADVICAMSQGVIVEMGTHEQLIQIPNGFYRSLARYQKIVE